jgi:hypothetical protein
LKSMKVNYNIFPDQLNHHIGTSMSRSAQLLRLD